jgi:hypothetical protein
MKAPPRCAHFALDQAAPSSFTNLGVENLADNAFLA